MKKIALFIIFLLFIASCAKTEERPLCKKPYFEWKAGEYCLDANNNQICDRDEMQQTIPQTEKFKKSLKASDSLTQVNPIESFLKEVPEKYWFHSFNTGKVVVNGNKRHSYINVENGITDIFWDTAKKEAFELCDINQEIFQEGDKFQKDRPICDPDFLNIRYLSPEEYETRFPMGPVDWMLKYKDKIPFRVETTIQTLGVRTISPVIHFKEDNGDITVLKFDQHFKVPVAIDTIRNNMRVKSLKYLYNTDFRLIGVSDPDKAMIPPKEKSLPEGPVVAVIDNYKLLLSNDVYVKGRVTNHGPKFVPQQNLFIECFDPQGESIGNKTTKTLEGITKKDYTDFKTYVPVKTRDLGRCTVKLL